MIGRVWTCSVRPAGRGPDGTQLQSPLRKKQQQSLRVRPAVMLLVLTVRSGGTAGSAAVPLRDTHPLPVSCEDVKLKGRDEEEQGQWCHPGVVRSLLIG